MLIKVVKRHILVFFLALFSGITFSQTNIYHPFPNSDALWNDSIRCGACSYKINGDTLVDGKIYHKLLAHKLVYQVGISQSCNPAPLYFSSYYSGAIREDTLTRKVYYLRPSDTSDTLLYNFTLNVGDTVRTYNNKEFP